MLHRFLLLSLLVVAAPAQAQGVEDARTAVRQAALDYVRALYEVDPSLVERSVSRDLVKLGYYRPGPEAAHRRVAMSYDELHALAATWNADGRRADPDTAPKRVTVHSVRDRTAAVSLEAAWGVDHMHLAKGDDGRWRIVHVLWESPRATTSRAAADALDRLLGREGVQPITVSLGPDRAVLINLPMEGDEPPRLALVRDVLDPEATLDPLDVGGGAYHGHLAPDGSAVYYSWPDPETEVYTTYRRSLTDGALGPRENLTAGYAFEKIGYYAADEIGAFLCYSRAEPAGLYRGPREGDRFGEPELLVPKEGTRIPFAPLPINGDRPLSMAYGEDEPSVDGLYVAAPTASGGVRTAKLDGLPYGWGLSRGPDGGLVYLVAGTKQMLALGPAELADRVERALGRYGCVVHGPRSPAFGHSHGPCATTHPRLTLPPTALTAKLPPCCARTLRLPSARSAAAKATPP